MGIFMKTVIENLSRGKIEHELPVIRVSVSGISERVEAGGTVHGSFEVYSDQNMELKGVIFCSTQHICVEPNQFVGTRTVIRYHISAENFVSEEVITGKLHIVSNGGEISLPYSIHVEEKSYHSSIGPIRNLGDFTRLAKDNFDESVKLFLYPDFPDVVLKHKFELRALYRGLSQGINPDLALEEFLLTAGKKEKLVFSLEEEEREYTDVTDTVRDKVVLTKNTWGYAEINVEVQGDFLFECRARVDVRDFVGNQYEYHYGIDSKKLRKGKNYGAIVFHVCGQTMTFSMVVCKEEDSVSEDIEYREMLGRLMDLYIQFRMQQYNYEKWTNDSMEIIDRLRRNDETDLMIRLMKAQMCLIKGKKEEAAFILDYVQGQLPGQKEHGVELRCYYDYIRTLQFRNSEYTKKIAANIQDIYEKQTGSWQLLWILLFIDERYEKNKSLKYAMIKERCCKNCSSPLLYFEALSVLNEHPGLLRILNPFEIRVLLMGAKRKYVTLRLALQTAELAKKERSFRPLVFDLLVRLYETYQTNDILAAICTLLIRGGQTENRYFRWFDMAVKNELKIPKLYEYYLKSIDMGTWQLLPKIIYMYFVNNTDAIRSRESFLFANIIHNKKEIPQIYENYKKMIEQYSVRQMLMGNVDEYLAVIYESVLSKALVTEDIAKRLPGMIFCYKLECNQPRMRRVIVVHRETGAEKLYPLVGGTTYVRLYSSGAAIIFQDADGNRYGKGVDYSLRKLMDMEYYLKLCFEMFPDNAELRLHFGDSGKARQTRQKPGKQSILPLGIEQILEIENLDEAYRTRLVEELVDYYYDHMDNDRIELYLEKADLKRMGIKSRAKVIELMIMHGMYREAYQVIRKYGAPRVAPGFLARFCTRIIPKLNECEDETVSYLCRRVFEKGIYDDNILKYMSRFYNGSLEELLSLWQTSKNFAFYSTELEERIIVQALFTGSDHPLIPQVFRKYYCYGFRPTIMKAYVNRLCYRYLVQDIWQDDNLMKYIRSEMLQGEKLHEYAKLAWVRYFSLHKDELKQVSHAEDLLKTAMEELMEKNIYMDYFGDFSYLTEIPPAFAQKSFLVFCGDPKFSLYMKYHIRGEKKWHMESMEQMLPGIFYKSFVLFGDDVLEYEILRIEENRERLLKAGRHRKRPQQRIGKNSCYDMIQAMIDAGDHTPEQERLIREFEEKRELAKGLL